MKPLFAEIEGWASLLDSLKNLYDEHGYVNGQLYEEAVKNLGDGVYGKIISLIKAWIPNEENLLEWAKRNEGLVDDRVTILG